MIEVGEYIRTKYGVIAKLDYIDEEDKFYMFDNTLYRDYGEPIDFLREDEIENDIKAHSKNIIDLIEVGDYVNGHKVQDIVKTDKKHILYCEGEYVGGGIQKNQIETVVTKEQFNNISYKVGDIE